MSMHSITQSSVNLWPRGLFARAAATISCMHNCCACEIFKSLHLSMMDCLFKEWTRSSAWEITFFNFVSRCFARRSASFCDRSLFRKAMICDFSWRFLQGITILSVRDSWSNRRFLWVIDFFNFWQILHVRLLEITKQFLWCHCPKGFWCNTRNREIKSSASCTPLHSPIVAKTDKRRDRSCTLQMDWSDRQIFVIRMVFPFADTWTSPHSNTSTDFRGNGWTPFEFAFFSKVEKATHLSPALEVYRNHPRGIFTALALL